MIKKTSVKKLMILFILVLLAGTAAWRIYSAQQQASLTVQPIAVTTATVKAIQKNNTIKISGSVEGVVSAIISSRFAGKIEQILVEDGQAVSQGATLTDRANDLSVFSATIGNSLQTLLAGTVIGKYSDNDERVDIRVRLTAMDRRHHESLNAIYVPSEKTKADGQKVLIPLSQVAEWQYTTSPAEINRYDRQKEIRLTANLEKTTLGDFDNQFYPSLQDMIIPEGYKVGAAGESDDMDESFSSMSIALSLAVVFIFMILAAQFESYIEPFAIMLSLPLAIIGALLGLFLAGSTMSVISAIGIMMLMGLVTKNAILLIDFAKQRMLANVPCNAALAEAARIRLRPIIMTSVAMILGMLPIALGVGPGSEARAPMAHAIIGGLITSTLLTLVVVPVVYSLIHEWKEQQSNFSQSE
jgi:HAE1 family hydrophobic/amphiphilic exporter-1